VKSYPASVQGASFFGEVKKRKLYSSFVSDKQWPIFNNMICPQGWSLPLGVNFVA
jgi:hypothetical protein